MTSRNDATVRMKGPCGGQSRSLAGMLRLRAFHRLRTQPSTEPSYVSISESNHPLSIYRSGRAVRWPKDAELDLLLDDLLKDELLWAVRPVGSLWGSWLGSETTRAPLPRRVRDLHLRGALSAGLVMYKLQRTLRPSTARPFRIQASLDRGLLKLWTTENHRLALFGRGQEPRTVKTLIAPATSTRVLDADSAEVAREVARRTGLDPDPLLLAFARAHSLRETLNEVIERSQPKSVITASTQHPFCRVAVAACRSLGVPSIYVPHAPTALNRTYADIPHDRAFLRGTADRDYYVSLGADPKAIDVVGDPMFALPESREPVGEPVILLATGVDRPLEELVRTFELVRASGVAQFGRVVVSPHPRGRGEVQRLAPRFGFEVVEVGKRTSHMLVELNVALMLVERSSGVSLEALVAGVPVLLLSHRPNYLFEVELGLTAADSSIELSSAVAEIAEREPTERVHADKVELFVSASGEQALEAVTRLATHAPVASSGVVDSWGWMSLDGAC